MFKKKEKVSQMPLVGEYGYYEGIPADELIIEEEPFCPQEAIEKMGKLNAHIDDIDYAINYKEGQIYDIAKKTKRNSIIDKVRKERSKAYRENKNLKLTSVEEKIINGILKAGVFIGLVSGIAAYFWAGPEMILLGMACGFMLTEITGYTFVGERIFNKIGKKMYNSTKGFTLNLIDNLYIINRLKKSKTSPKSKGNRSRTDIYEVCKKHYDDIKILEENRENTDYDKWYIKNRLRDYKYEHPEEEIPKIQRPKCKNSFVFMPGEERNIEVSGIRKTKVRK